MNILSKAVNYLHTKISSKVLYKIEKDLIYKGALRAITPKNGESVFDYSFIMSLDEKDYEKYLSYAYFIKEKKTLNLKNPKTVNEKIQWLKMNDNLPIKAQLTDKVLVRDWVKDKIGEKYLKNVLWVGKEFDKIPFDSLPDSFIIKTNHGCKWHFIVKNKQTFLANSQLFRITKITVDNWMTQSFFGWSDFETQYKNIAPQIIVEELYRDANTKGTTEFEVWCFNGEPKISQEIRKENKEPRVVSTYDENLKNIDLKFDKSDIIKKQECNDYLLKAVELSKILCKDFKLVRVDWMLHNNQLYFCEMTFTPYSGFISFPNEYQQWQLTLGKMLNLKGN